MKKQTERVVKSRDRLGEENEKKKKERKRKLRQSGKLSSSISIWTQRTLPNMESQTVRGACRQGGRGREVVSYVVQYVNSSSGPIESRETERGADRVTFPGVDQVVRISWDGHFLIYY